MSLSQERCRVLVRWSRLLAILGGGLIVSGILGFTASARSVFLAAGVFGVRARWRGFKPLTCDDCGYSRRGNTTGICPECGAPVKPDPLAEFEHLGVRDEHPPRRS